MQVFKLESYMLFVCVHLMKVLIKSCHLLLLLFVGQLNFPVTVTSTA